MLLIKPCFIILTLFGGGTTMIDAYTIREAHIANGADYTLAAFGVDRKSMVIELPQQIQVMTSQCK